MHQFFNKHSFEVYVKKLHLVYPHCLSVNRKCTCPKQQSFVTMLLVTEAHAVVNQGGEEKLEYSLHKCNETTLC